MRFAVRGPGIPTASPRSHGVPRRDVPGRVIRAGLFRPVLAAVPLAGAKPGDRVLDPPAAVRSPLGAGELTLQPPQSVPISRGQAGSVQQLTCRQGRADHDAPVNPDDLPVAQVPYVPGMRAVVPQHRLLGGRGKQPVPGHTNTLTTTTDIPEEVMRRFLPDLKAGVLTPRI